MIARKFGHSARDTAHAVEVWGDTPRHGFDGSSNHSFFIGIIAQNTTGKRLVNQVFNAPTALFCQDNCVCSQTVSTISGNP